MIFLLYKTSYLNEEVNCTEPSPQLVFPGLEYETYHRKRHTGLFSSASEAKGQNKLELFVSFSLSSLIFASKAGAYPGGASYSARLSA